MNKLNLITPCFIFDEDEFVHNIKMFSGKLNDYFNKSIIGYSFKTNSLPRLLHIALKNDCYAEVVSDDEYKLAKTIGYPGNRIIFNGPIKSKEYFLEALTEGSIVNIDSKREIEWLKTSKFDMKVKVGIRVNFDIEKYLPDQLPEEISGGRFGFSYENGELKKAIDSIKKFPNVIISGLHMHISNSSKKPEVYGCLADIATEIILKENLEVTYIDFGGGYFGGGDNGEEYENYISAIKRRLVNKVSDDIMVIFEPGASLVATAFTYLTKVVDKKKTLYGDFIVTDGTRLHIDPFLHKKSYNYNRYPQKTGKKSVQTICGYTCMEKDRIMNVEDVEFNVGECIEYNIVGSYSLTFNPLFISFFPTVYSRINNDYEIVRKKWDVEDFLQENRWKF